MTAETCCNDEAVGRHRRWKWLTGLLLALLAMLLLLLRSCLGGDVVAPLILAPISGAELPVGKITFSGTGEPNSTVELFMGDVALGETLVDADGAWQMRANIEEAGIYNFSVSGTNLDSGDVMAESANVLELSFVESDSPPMEVEANEDVNAILTASAPSIIMPASSFFTLGPIEMVGTSDPFARVQFLLGREAVAIAEADADGNWHYTLSSLDAGDYTFTANTLDGDGNVIASSEEYIFTIGGEAGTLDLTNSEDPSFVLPVLSALQGGAFDLSGSGTPGHMVEFIVNDEVYGSTAVDIDRLWHYTFNFAESGNYTLFVNTLDGDGNVLASSEEHSFTVDGEAATLDLANPVTPTFELPDLSTLQSGAFDLSGSGTPGNTIEFIVNGEVHGSTEIDTDGLWLYAFNFAESGGYTLTASTLDGDGNVLASSEVYSFTVVGEAAILDLANPVTSTFELPDLSALQSGAFELSGSGVAGNTIEFIVNGEVHGSTEIDTDGLWLYTFNFAESGGYTLTASTLDGDGNVLASSEVYSFTVGGEAATLDLANPVTPTFELPDLSALQSGSFELSGSGVAGNTIEFIVNGEVHGSTEIDTDGLWLYAFNFAESGGYTLTASTLDGDGNVLASSEVYSFTVVGEAAILDLANPVTSTFELPDLSALQSGAFELSGSGVAGNSIEFIVNGEVHGSTEIDADGHWHYAFNFVESGDYTLVINTLGGNGNVIASSEEYSFAVDGGTPTPNLADSDILAFELPALSTLQSGAFELSGNGIAGNTIAFIVNGEAHGSTEIDADGHWHYAFNFVESGDYTLVINTLDGNGNVIASSEEYSFAVDGGTPTPNLADSDILAFELPALSTLQSGAFELSGSGVAGNTIEFIVNDEVHGFTEVDTDGLWLYTFNFAESGDYILTANTLDGDGNVLASSEEYSFTVSGESATLDLAGSEVPDFELPALSTLQSGAFELSGSGAAGNTIEFVVNSEVHGSTEIDADSLWHYAFNFVESGNYTLFINTLDGNGNVIASSEEYSFTVGGEAATLDLANPVTPTFELPDLSALQRGSFELSGSGVAGNTIEFIVNGEVHGSTEIDTDGLWLYAFNFAESGGYTLTASTLDGDGNVLAASKEYSFTVVGEAAILDLANPVTSTFELPDLSALQSGAFELSGGGAAGNTIEFIVNGEVHGSIEVDATGLWHYAFNLVESGDYWIEANILDKDKNIINTSERRVLSLPALETPLEGTKSTMDSIESIDHFTPPVCSIDRTQVNVAEQIHVRIVGQPRSRVQVVTRHQIHDTVNLDDDGTAQSSIAFKTAGVRYINCRLVDEADAVLALGMPSMLNVMEE